MNWLDPNGKVDPVAMAALQAWQKTDRVQTLRVQHCPGQQRPGYGPATTLDIANKTVQNIPVRRHPCQLECRSRPDDQFQSVRLYRDGEHAATHFGHAHEAAERPVDNHGDIC